MAPRPTQELISAGKRFVELFAADPELTTALEKATAELAPKLEAIRPALLAAMAEHRRRLADLGFSRPPDGIRGYADIARRLGIDPDPMQLWEVVGAVDMALQVEHVSELHREAGRLKARRVAELQGPDGNPPGPPKPSVSRNSAYNRAAELYPEYIATLGGNRFMLARFVGWLRTSREVNVGGASAFVGWWNGTYRPSVRAAERWRAENSPISSGSDVGPR